MNLEFIRMILLSVKRRHKSMWKVALISFCCVFLFTGIMIFQDCMNRFQRENAFLESGEWIISTTEKSRQLEEHAWVDGYGATTVRTDMCSRPEDMNMENTKGIGAVGVADEEFLQLSGIVLYSGKMPEQPDEIALTQHVLSDMGHNFQLGQILPLAYLKGYDVLGNPSYGYVDYKLVGIVENYTADWKASGELPEYFVTEEGLSPIQNVDWEDSPRYWYYLNRAQRDINGAEFYKSIKEMCRKQGENQVLFNMVYNSNAYDVTMWGNRNLYLVMMGLCGILGSMSLLYLFLMCCNNRRPYYFKLRELGASAGQVRGMVCMEWSSVFAPSAMLGMIAAGLVSLVVSALISRHFGIPFVFRLTGNSVRMILLFTVGVFLLVMVWSCLLFRMKNLHQMTGIIAAGRLKHMYRKRDRRKELIRLFQIRRKRAEPWKNLAQTLFIIAAMTIFLYSLWMIRSACRTYQNSENQIDIYAWQRGEGQAADWGEATFYEKEPLNLEPKQACKDLSVEKGDSVENGMPTDVVPDLLNVAGVTKICETASDNQIGLVWDGMRESSFLKDLYVSLWLDEEMKLHADNLKNLSSDAQTWHNVYNEIFAEIPDPAERPELFNENVTGIARTEKRDALLRKLLGKEFRSEDFWSGKQSILFLVKPDQTNDLQIADDEPADSALWKPLQGMLDIDSQNRTFFRAKWGEEYPYHFKDSTIQTGDSLQITHALLQDEISTEVICCDDELYRELMNAPAICGGTESYLYDVSEMIQMDGGVQLLASEDLLKTLADGTGKDFTYRSLNIDVEEEVNRKQVEADVADVLSHYGDEGISFHSYMGKKAQEKTRFYRQAIMFGVILVLTGAVYLFINRSMQNKSMELIRKQMQQFLQCGCSRADLMKSYGRQKIRETLWALWGVPLCMLIPAVEQGVSYWKECQRTGEMKFQSEEMMVLCMDAVKAYFNNPVGWIVFVVFLALAAWLGIREQRKYLRELELMGHEE